MNNIFRNLIITTLCIYSFTFQCKAQSQELQECYNRISSLFHNYPTQIHYLMENRGIEYRDITLTYKHPYITIAYYTQPYGDTQTPKSKLNKNSIKFILKNAKFSISLNRINIFCEDMEFIEYGRKKLNSYFTFVTDFTLTKKIHNELCAFQDLVNKTNFTGTIGTHSSSPKPNNSNPNRKVIKMQKLAGNTFTVPCKVNGLPLKFIFDTGASSVQISKSEAIFMLKNGYLSENDITGTQYFQTASGDIIEGTRIIIRKIEIGGMVLRNVEASVVHSDNAPLLLGQSVLSRLGKIQIDYSNSTLTIIR